MLDITQEGTEKKVTIPRGDVYYQEVGEGQPVVFLHGSGPGATGWSNFASNMAELGEKFRCIAIDLPGWGKSFPVTWDQRDHHIAVRDVLDALGIDKAAVVGNSMGGAVAIKFAATFPDRITHLITMGAGSPAVKLFGPGDGPTEGLKVLQEGYRNPSVEQMKKLTEIMTFDSGNATDALAKQRSDNAKANQTHLDNFKEGLGKPRKGMATDDELRQITCPTLLIHGRDDRVVHYENSLYLCAVISDSRVVLINR
ncbi:MAG: alpha/beta hydrolase, partial [Propionibacteriaceae bacterium]|nr:alpha/beta hydrolase [Propionibacteriaceae bacterium]